MADLSVIVGVVPKGRKVACRYLGLNGCELSNRYLPEGTKYISIRGYAASGSTTLAICEHHADDFFKQVQKAKRELKKL